MPYVKLKKRASAVIRAHAKRFPDEHSTDISHDDGTIEHFLSDGVFESIKDEFAMDMNEPASDWMERWAAEWSVSDGSFIYHDLDWFTTTTEEKR